MQQAFARVQRATAAIRGLAERQTGREALALEGRRDWVEWSSATPVPTVIIDDFSDRRAPPGCLGTINDGRAAIGRLGG